MCIYTHSLILSLFLCLSFFFILSIVLPLSVYFFGGFPFGPRSETPGEPSSVHNFCPRMAAGFSYGKPLNFL